MPVTPDKRREYARNYYRKHREEILSKRQAHPPPDPELTKQRRRERWLRERYVPEAVQRAILWGAQTFDEPDADQSHSGQCPILCVQEATTDTCSDQSTDC